MLARTKHETGYPKGVGWDDARAWLAAAPRWGPMKERHDAECIKESMLRSEGGAAAELRVPTVYR